MIGTIIDIETTGFLEFQMNGIHSELSDKSEILEVGYININLETFDIVNYGVLYFYKPYFNIESEAQKVHGITREFISKYEADFDKNLIALAAMLENAVFIGKNNRKFDLPFIQAFIKKHAKFHSDLPTFISGLNMKDYDGRKLYYDSEVEVIDVQEEACDLWRARYFGRTMSTTTKKGTLSQYIEYMPGGQDLVDEVYNDMDAERKTRAHGALYDCVMTYIAYIDNICYWNKPEYTKDVLTIRNEMQALPDMASRQPYVAEQIEAGCPVETMLQVISKL